MSILTYFDFILSELLGGLSRASAREHTRAHASTRERASARARWRKYDFAKSILKSRAAGGAPPLGLLAARRVAPCAGLAPQITQI